MKLNIENIICRNCGVEMPQQSLYCPKCSQKNTDGRIPIFSFVKDIFENLFNLDSKLFRTSLGLFIPGKLTNEFFKGKHKSFATPSRMFLVSAILFFAMINWIAKKELLTENVQGDILGIGKKLETKEERLATIEKLRANAEKSDNEEMLIALDSFEARTLRTEIDTNVIDIQLFFNDYKIEAADLVKLPIDSILQKYQIESIIDKVIFTKAYKSYQDPKSLITFILGNLTWMLILLVPSVALILKLLYYRRKKYFVEHLVFLFHVHSFGLILGTIILIFTDYFEFGGGSGAISILIFGMVIYFLIAMRKVYQQSWWKTILKLFIIGISYLVILLLCVGIIFTLSFIFF